MDVNSQFARRCAKLAAMCACLNGALFAQSPGCKITDRIDSVIDRIGEIEAMRAAPVVLLATVLDAAGSKQSEAGRFRPEVAVERHVVKCRLEKALRTLGTIPITKDFEFEYYALAGVDPADMIGRNVQRIRDRHGAGVEPQAGIKYLLFLETECGKLRPVRDRQGFAVPIFGGVDGPTHVTALSLNDSEFGKTIAEVLLLLRANSDTEQFAEHIHDYRFIAEALWSRLGAFGLVRNLLSSKSPLVRFEACRELARSYHGQRDCLSAIASDNSQSDTIRQRASQLSSDTASDDQWLDWLEKGTAIWKSNSLQKNYQDLVILMASADTRYRKAACTWLKRDFPESTEARTCRTSIF